MLPARNRKDFEDIPEKARTDLEFIWLERVDDAVTAGLESDAPRNTPSAGKAARHLADMEA